MRNSACDSLTAGDPAPQGDAWKAGLGLLLGGHLTTSKAGSMTALGHQLTTEAAGSTDYACAGCLDDPAYLARFAITGIIKCCSGDTTAGGRVKTFCAGSCLQMLDKYSTNQLIDIAKPTISYKPACTCDRRPTVEYT